MVGVQTKPRWLEIAMRKRELQQSALASFTKAHPVPELLRSLIGMADITEVSEELAMGKVNASDLVIAYCHQAAVAHKKSNCLTGENLMIQPSFTDLTSHRNYKHGKTIGPLHGIVMTLKDQFDVKGVDSTLGYCGRAFQPAQENALLVNILQDLGAIFIAKTNLPQSIMWCETENPLWGVTTNPTNPDLTPGGSTGGESAVLSQMGSLVGWGTDLGGSIRIPSHMMGLYGLKPSHGRLPYDRVSVSTEGQGHVPSIVGPLARSLSSLKHVTQAVIEAQSWSTDPQIVPIPWRPDIFDEVQQRPLVVGLLVDDGTVRAHPPTIRVLQETIMQNV
ncbi:acetamidase, partial [Aureobasidium melanogenum]